MEEKIMQEMEPGPESNDTGRQMAYEHVKSSLLKCVTDSGENMYEHLVRVIKHFLKAGESGTKDDFWKIMESLQRYEPYLIQSSLKKAPSVSDKWEDAKVHQKDFEIASRMKEKSHLLPDFQEIFSVLIAASTGLSESEVVYLTISMKKFVSQTALKSVRFWGKIMGTRRNYYVLEAELEPNQAKIEHSSQPRDLKKAIPNERDDFAEENDVGENEPREAIDADIPYEEPGIGVNKFTYFVCNALEDEWVRLPEAKPEHIIVSRKIRLLFTGDLEAEVKSHPPFPGKEKHYLRAQIARISASTIISPLDFYRFEEEDEEILEEELGQVKLTENSEYEPLPVDELADPTMENWVHHAAYILPQGRTIWWDPSTFSTKKRKEYGSEEEYEEELEEEELEPMEPEVGPPLLASVAEDEPILNDPAWSTRVTSKICPDRAYAVASSNRWPGAHAVSSGGFFHNIYIGWGQKYTGQNYQPMLPPKISDGQHFDLEEAKDPSPEEEAAYQAKLDQKEAERLEREKRLREEEEEMEEEQEDDEEESEDE